MIWFLLVLYQIKHFVCDYPLQTPYMLGKFKPYPNFILPLLAHAGVHALATFLICCAFNFTLAIKLAILDGVIHFIVDRIKASPNMLGKFKNFSGNEYALIQRNIEPPKNDAACTINNDGLFISVNSLSEENKVNIFKSNMFFWWALGADQFMHHITHYFIIWSILK